jgi:hypothetical protein
MATGERRQWRRSVPSSRPRWRSSNASWAFCKLGPGASRQRRVAAFAPEKRIESPRHLLAQRSLRNSMNSRLRRRSLTRMCTSPVSRSMPASQRLGDIQPHCVAGHRPPTPRPRAWLSFAPPRCRMPLGQSQCIPQADPGGRVSPRF